MTEDNPKGAYSRPSIFKGKNCVYWKENMYVNLVYIDRHLWVEITDERLIPKNEADNHIKLSKDG